jgi:hypothetical protein
VAENGRLPKADLAPIPSGELAIEAAAAWNAPGGPAAAGLRPTGPESSYRTRAEQEALYKLYLEGRGNLAAIPGTSNHGWGLAVDLAEPWMRTWIDEHGAPFGWRKTEAPSEWWHVNYDGTKHFPTFVVLKHGDHGKRVEHYTRRLAYIHKPHGGAYLPRDFARFRGPVEVAVRDFQKNFHIGVDGEIGATTGAKIDGVFHRQYHERHRAHHLPKGSHR